MYELEGIIDLKRGDKTEERKSKMITTTKYQKVWLAPSNGMKT